jgi:hypothetical protein
LEDSEKCSFLVAEEMPGFKIRWLLGTSGAPSWAVIAQEDKNKLRFKPKRAQISSTGGRIKSKVVYSLIK